MRTILLAAFTLVVNMTAFTQKSCVSVDYQRIQYQKDTSLLKKLDQQEVFIKNHIHSQEIRSSVIGSTSGVLSVIRIPVVVHILYNKPEENISDAQIMSQIIALNKEFRKAGDLAHVPSAFRSLAADTYIEFSLAKVNPQGLATTGITRKQSNIRLFGLDDRIKFSKIGGEDAWDADRYLNIWVGNIAGAIIGYSSLAGSDKNKDGVVIRYDAFGTTGKVSSGYNKGRTAVHEIGHWLGLYHIWGDQYCGDDKVDDTPPQQAPSRGCPSGTVSSMCSADPAGKMYMNFMDLTDDACLSMFTYGQRDRMRAMFAPGGSRHALLLSDALTATPRESSPADEEKTIGKFSLYPNPAISNVTLEMNETDLGKQVIFYSPGGRIVSHIRITKRSMVINVSSYATGVYFVKIGDEKKMLKFIKGN